MLLNLDDLTVDELNKKVTTLGSRLNHLQMYGSHGSGAYNQCLVWIQQITWELEERGMKIEMEANPKEWKSGVVSTIGRAGATGPEDHFKTDEELRSSQDGKKDK